MARRERGDVQVPSRMNGYVARCPSCDDSILLNIEEKNPILDRAYQNNRAIDLRLARQDWEKIVKREVLQRRFSVKACQGVTASAFCQAQSNESDL